MNLRKLLAGPAFVVLAALATTAQAQNYSFSCLTNNNATDCATGAGQFSLGVTDNGGVVDFRFTNSGPAPSSITDIYFDWSSTSGITLAPGTLTDSGAGVLFSWAPPVAPSNLPGGGAISFSADLAVDSSSPAQQMGVNTGEWLNIAFSSNADLISALNSGALRVGIHTQGYEGGGSESFVTTPIPEPETYAMLLAGSWSSRI
jgi:hypothetical protein